MLTTDKVEISRHVEEDKQNKPARGSNYVMPLTTKAIGIALSHASGELGVENVSEAISRQVDSQDRERKEYAGESDCPDGLGYSLASVSHHGAPARYFRRCAGPKEA